MNKKYNSIEEIIGIVIKSGRDDYKVIKNEDNEDEFGLINLKVGNKYFNASYKLLYFNKKLEQGIWKVVTEPKPEINNTYEIF
jgi:hypothetical protein